MSAKISKNIKKLVDSMTIGEKVGATLTVLAYGTSVHPVVRNLIENFACGGLRIVPTIRFHEQIVDFDKSGSTQFSETYSIAGEYLAPSCSPSSYAKILSKYQEYALRRPSPIPLHISYDQEGNLSGDFKFGNMPLYPPPMGIAAAGDPKLAYQVAFSIARVARAMGINMIHSPDVDINTNPYNPEINTRAYSDTPEVVAQYALESARGFKDGGLIATAKHFPGRGDSDVDAHTAVPEITADFDTLWNRELLPYRELIAADLLPAIMIAHSKYPALDVQNIATVSPAILQGLLRDKLGFEGVITTDAIGMHGIRALYDIPEACVQSLRAGADMVLLRHSTSDPIVLRVPEIIAHIEHAVEQGTLPLENLDQKVGRLLQMKEDAGLFSQRESDNVTDLLSDKEIRRIEIEASHNTIIARSEPQELPLEENCRALIIEQAPGRFFLPCDDNWYNGLFYDSLCEFSPNLSYVETDLDPTDEQQQRAFIMAEQFDTIIVTSWFRRGVEKSSDFVARLCARPGKKVICVSNTPYKELTIPEEAQNAVVQFGLSPASIRNAASILFGKTQPKANWPITYTLETGLAING